MQGFPPLEVAPSQNIRHAVDDLPMPENIRTLYPCLDRTGGHQRRGGLIIPTDGPERARDETGAEPTRAVRACGTSASP